MKKDNYVITGTRHEAALYMAWEYGIKIAVREMRKLKHYGGHYKHLYIIPSFGRPLRLLRDAKQQIAHMSAVISWQHGRLGQGVSIGYVGTHKIKDLVSIQQ